LVLYSNKQSLENREVSFLAIIEIIIAVVSYWYVAYYFNFYWHIVLSIGIAPLLLLQSSKSIKFSLLFLNKKNENFMSKFSFFLSLIILLITMFYIGNTIFNIMKSILSPHYLFGWFFVNKPIFSLFLLFVIFGFIVGMMIPFETKESKSGNLSNVNEEIIKAILMFFLFIPLGIGMGLGIVVIFFIIKFIATIVNLKDGYSNISINWFYNVFVQDIMKTPEIMTGIEHEDEIDDIYKISKIYHLLFQPDNFFRKILLITLLFSFYPFAIFYRLSIKSTFWFYAPLLLVVKAPNLNNSAQVGKFLSEQYQTIWARIRGILALGTITAFILTYFQYYAFSEVNEIPFFTVISMLYLDFSSIEVWRIFQLIVAILTLGLFLYANAVRVPAVENNIPLKNDYRVMTIYYANSFRNWISLLYFTSSFIFLAYYFKVWEYPYMPHFMEELLTSLVNYIQYKPFN